MAIGRVDGENIVFGHGDQGAIPIMFTVNLDRREAGRQRTTRHDVLGTDRVGCRVKINEISSSNIDAADTATHRLAVEAIEIDQAFQGDLQGGGVIKARRCGMTVGNDPVRRARFEKAGGACHKRLECA